MKRPLLKFNSAALNLIFYNINSSNSGLQSQMNLEESNDVLPSGHLMPRRHNRSHPRASSNGAFVGPSSKFNQIIFPCLDFEILRVRIVRFFF